MFPYEITPVEPGLNKQLMDNFKGERTGFCQVGPEKYTFPAKYAEQAEGYYNMSILQDDVFIATFPRSGTTVCQEMVWLICNDHNYEKAAETSLSKRFPFLEVSIILHPKLLEEVLEINNNDPNVGQMLSQMRIPGYEKFEHLPSPRFLKTHLPFSLLPPDLLNTSKAIYLARNPIDVAISYYYHNRLTRAHDYKGDFETYWKYFKDGVVVYGPSMAHIMEAWELRNHPNMLFLFYEELIQDLPKTIKRISDFLNKPITDAQLHKLVNHLQIDNFRKCYQSLNIEGFSNKGEKDFIRKGVIGQGQLEFSEELRMEAEKWVSENLSRTDLRFPCKFI